MGRRFFWILSAPQLTMPKIIWHHQRPVLLPQRALIIPKTPEKQDSDLKSHLMMMVEYFKKDVNKSLKEIQENTGKEVEDIK
jgi:hypothetical protein